MTNDFISVSIPTELKQFEKVVETLNTKETQEEYKTEFGVKLIKNANGQVSEAKYYSDSGELVKKIYYNGPSVSKIEYYRNNKVRSEELYTFGKMLEKNMYNNFGQKYCSIIYEYHQKELLTSIIKKIKDSQYKVKYEYDEFNRIDSRILFYNAKIINTQKFKYDIIDRIIEYADNNQEIKVEKINTNNELIKYTITDKAGNKMQILNKFLCMDYIGTEVELNGHKTNVKDRNYVDNVMLKKPYASEDDLDFAMSCIFDRNKVTPIKRENTNDITTDILVKKLRSEILPISVRKMHLINNKTVL